MSGGAFNYVQFQFSQAAEEVEDFLHEKNKEEWYDYPPEVLERFKEAAHTIKQAGQMLQRVDWLVSGDDSVESFMKRWDKEVLGKDPEVS